MSAPTGVRPETARLDHAALLYRDAAQYLAPATEFVQAALEADSPVLVAVPPRGLDLIRDGLGRDAADVTFVDMCVKGRNPGGILPAVMLDFAVRHPDRRVSIIGEPCWPGRRATELPACAAHEAMVNVAFAGRDAAILCPYDAARLPEAVIGDAHRTHPELVDGRGVRWASSAYTDPLQIADRTNEPLPPPATATVARRTYRRVTELAAVRAFVTACARAAGMPRAATSQLVAAVNELTTNTLEHAGGAGQVSVWVEGSAVVCQVDDGGHLPDPLVGRVPPARHQLTGRGLVLVNQLCDLVRVYTRPGQTSIRVYAYL